MDEGLIEDEVRNEVRDRFERNEASRRKLVGEAKSTHPSHIVNCQSQVISGFQGRIN